MLNLAWSACAQMLTSKVERSLQAQTMLIISTCNMTTATCSNTFYQHTCTAKLHFTDTHFLQTIPYYRQFSLTLGEAHGWQGYFLIRG